MNFFLNLTIVSFTLKSLKVSSPFVSPPNMNHYQLFSFYKSDFSQLFSSVLRFQLIKSQSLIDACRFSKIINSILIFESDFSINNEVYFHSIAFENDTIATISNCQFISINLEIENKSAITSFIPINIFNSLFREIKGGYGSCISTNSSLSLNYSTFYNNKGHTGGCFFIDSFFLHDTIIENTIFLSNMAKYSPLFYRKCLGDLIIRTCNISHSESTDCVGVFENSGVFVNLKFSYFAQCKAQVHYGGIILKDAQNVLITNCNFYELEHNSDLMYSSSAVFISNCKNNNQIIDSAFFNCVNIDSYNAYIISCTDTLSLTIYKCIFSDNRKNSIYKKSDLSIMDCQFDAHFTQKFESFDKIGYSSSRTSMKRKGHIINNMSKGQNKLSKNQLTVMARNISIRFIISFIFAFFIASVINYFHVKFFQSFRTKTRKERL